MKTLKCVICKTLLPAESGDNLCDRERCKLVIDMRVKLVDQIKQFKEFFLDKAPSEENYRDYLELVGLEDAYIQFACRGDVDREPKCSRRVWFTMNFAQSHHEWMDEFNRPWAWLE